MFGSRYRSSFALSVFLGVCFAVGACGVDDVPSSASSATQELYRAQCQAAFDCKSSYDVAGHQSTFAATYGASVSECTTNSIALMKAFYGADYLTKLDASVALGRISYDGSLYSTCEAELSDITCDELFAQHGQKRPAPPEACEMLIKGTVANGGACTLEFDCADHDANCDGTTNLCTR